jgi:hypothetical protein
MQASFTTHRFGEENARMAKDRTFLTFEALLKEAARPHRALWKDDGDLNLGELARQCEAKGYPLSEASLSRILRNKQEIGERAINALHRTLDIPKSLLRGEPMSSDLEKALTESRLSTLMLAKRIEDLPKDEYYALVEQVARIEERERRMKEALRNSNVTSIDRVKR